MRPLSMSKICSPTGGKRQTISMMSLTLNPYCFTSLRCRTPDVPQRKIIVRTNKEQCEDDDELIDSVSKDVLRHGAGDERLVATVWLPL